MTTKRKIELLSLITENKPHTRNNKEMAYLQASGYIKASGVVNCSYIKATITITEWGKIWLKSKTSGVNLLTFGTFI